MPTTYYTFIPMSTIILRNYQKKLKQQIYDSWATGNKNVIATLPTGAGKTVIFSHIIAESGNPCCAIAHRRELVGQISLALAYDGVKHKIIGPESVKRELIQSHVYEFGRSFYDPNAYCAVAGVDTLIRREAKLANWLPTVKLWVIDEAHHITRKNKWGRAVTLFKNAHGLGVTATPTRTDCRGLGGTADGVFDELIVGVGMRELIETEFLTDYRIFAPASDLSLQDVNISAGGEYSHKPLVNAVRKSHIIGGVIAHYKRIASGKLGVTFVTDVQTASDIAAQFNASGVPSEMVCAKTPDRVRAEILRRFRNREILQVVNVDLFGEGFDLPALEVVSMARPTQSFGLYVQQFGRALRPMPGKKHAIIIDHVGNVMRHGLPDAPRAWNLIGKKRTPATPIIPIRICPNCMAAYERINRVCPYCGHYEEPTIRNAPEFVDGSLVELDEATLLKMRQKIVNVIDGESALAAHLRARGCPKIGILTAVKRYRKTQQTQIELREAIALWGGYNKSCKRSDDEGHRRFFYKFGVDVLTAQGLRALDAAVLTTRIQEDLRK